MTGPERIWVAKCHPFNGDNFYVSDGTDRSSVEYVRADLAQSATDAAVRADRDDWMRACNLAVQETMTANADLITARAEIARLQGAMEWYADPSNYQPRYVMRECGCGSDVRIPTQEDGGNRARAALAPKPGVG